MSIAIIGLGVTGLSFAEYCIKHNKVFAVYDTRDEPPNASNLHHLAPNVPVLTLNQGTVIEAEQILLSPGVSRYHPAIARAIEAGIEVIGDVELFVREIKAPIIAITGTNGKSTVTTLVGEMAKAAGISVGVGGNLGQAVLNFLQQPPKDLYVLELSSFQLESLFSLKNHFSTILNITPDHLDRYPEGLAQYITVKQNIYTNSKNIVYNRADQTTKPTHATPAHITSFGTDEPAPGHWGVRMQQNKAYLAHGTECLLAVDDLTLKGWHQVANVLASLALGHQAGFPMQNMLDV